MTNNTKANNARTREAHDAYVANRKEAGRLIDTETCEIAWWPTFYFDPYRTYPFDDDPTREFEQCRTYLEDCFWVRSEESDGWIEEHDLPEEKRQALQRRYARRMKLWEAARAAHPKYEVVTHTDWFPGCDEIKWDEFKWDEIKWKGDGEEPSPDALIEWFKVNHPAQASVVESKIRRRELEIERQQAQDHPAVRG